MSTVTKVVIVLALAGAVAATMALKSEAGREPSAQADLLADSGLVGDSGKDPALKAPPLPKLIDLGADKCVPCRMMAPILEELKQEYAASFETQFIDVWKNPGVGEKYDIRLIPTQIFYDAQGKELFRHEGFYSKEEILAAWKKLGVL